MLQFLYLSQEKWLQSNLFFLITLYRAFSVSGKVRPEEAVQATLSSLPDEVVDTVGVTALPSEDLVSERRRKLEFLEMQEELIKVGYLFATCSSIFLSLKPNKVVHLHINGFVAVQ